MSEGEATATQESLSSPVAVWTRRASIGVFVGAIAWAPFPLGSAVSWGAPLLQILVGVSWMLWAISAAWSGEAVLEGLRKIWIPAMLVVVVLLWVWVQMLPGVPGLTPHPVWSMANDILRRPLPSSISIDPWRTHLELLKLTSEVAAFWLALCFASNSATARFLLQSAVVITSVYAFYGIVLTVLDTSQASLVYGIPLPPLYISGPFMLHNSFATFCGMGLVAAMGSLFTAGDAQIVSDRGPRRLALSVIQFVFGRGALHLLSCVLLSGALIASASRAGFASTLVGLAVVATVAVIRSRRGKTRRWAFVGMAAAVAPFALFIVGSGDELVERLTELIDAGNADVVRLALWSASLHMIDVFPWTGLGLGTFEDAYPMFATSVLQFVMDKAHSDYLELIMGIGIPAAVAWWAALLLLVGRCLRGSLTRRRNVLFPLTAFGASVLVGVHSAVDFSLQIPADALLYAMLLGIGVAQSERTNTKSSSKAA